jgi:Flp pilus assembly pilin Flp
MLDRINTFVANAWLAAQDGFKREEGQAMAEYALILAVIAVGVVATLVLLGGSITTKLGAIKDSILAH